MYLHNLANMWKCSKSRNVFLSLIELASPTTIEVCKILPWGSTTIEACKILPLGLGTISAAGEPNSEVHVIDKVDRPTVYLSDFRIWGVRRKQERCHIHGSHNDMITMFVGFRKLCLYKFWTSLRLLAGGPPAPSSCMCGVAAVGKDVVLEVNHETCC